MPAPLVLCYHAVSPTWPAALSTTQERLAEQLEHLAGRGYRGVTFAEAAAERQGRKVVAVTFDDAFASVARLGRPVLDAVGWPATIFAPTDHPGARRPLAWAGTDQWLETEWAGELEPLGWPELRELQDAGWEIGSHTCSHPFLTRIDDAQLERELTASREACIAELGGCATIAYPYGDVDARVVAAAGRAGYAAGATLPPKPHAAEPLHFPRVGVYHADDLRRFRLKTSRSVTALRTWAPARRR